MIKAADLKVEKKDDVMITISVSELVGLVAGCLGLKEYSPLVSTVEKKRSSPVGKNIRRTKLTKFPKELYSALESLERGDILEVGQYDRDANISYRQSHGRIHNFAFEIRRAGGTTRFSQRTDGRRHYVTRVA